MRPLSRLLFLLPALLAGCASYQPQPLRQGALNRALTPPDEKTLAQAALHLRHPRLPPMRLNFSKPLTPKELAVISVLVNPDLKALRAKEGISAAQVFNAGLLPDPQLSASLDHPVGSGPGYVNAYSVGANWDIARLLTRPLAQQAARAKALQTRYDVAWQEWLTANQARLLGVRLAYLQQQEAIAQRAQAVADRLYRAARYNLDHGDIKIDEFALRETALMDARDRLLALRREITKNRQDLNRTLGLPPATRLLLATTPPPLHGDNDPAALFRRAQKERLDLLALRAGYASQEAALHEAVLAQFPSFNLGFTQASDTSNVHTIGLGISFNIPVFNRNRGQIAIARATRAQLYAEYVARLHQARADIATLAADIRRIDAERGALAAKLPSLTSAEAVMREAANRRDIPLLNYEAVRANLLSNELKLLALEQSAAEQQIGLDIAVGAPMTP